MRPSVSYEMRLKKRRSFVAAKTVIGFVNSYWKSLYQTILPQTKPVWEAIVVQETNKILAHLPISAVLVDSKRASKA